MNDTPAADDAIDASGPRRVRTPRVLWAAALAMGAVAAYRVAVELYRLACEPLGSGASTDLKKRHIEVQAWFSGERVYGAIESADYPPASYVLFRPFVGFEDLDTVRAVWALTVVVVLAWLGALLVRECRAAGRAERLLVAATPLASYAVAANIRIGQVGLHLLALLVAGGATLAGRGRSWGRDLLAAAAFAAAMCKPTFSAPFFWVALALGGLRTAVLIVAGYVALTLLGASYQPDDLATLIRGWLGQGAYVEYGTAHANVHTWLGLAGLDAWLVPASLALLAASGVWTWLHRDRDAWVLLGVAALVSRFWSYHRWYDDVLVFLPMVALFRELKSDAVASTPRRVALVLLVPLAVLGTAPASLLSMAPPWSDLFKSVKTAAWLATLAYLLWTARRRPSAAVSG